MAWRCRTATSFKVYAAVREHGGLAIADEVQVGYGRLGEWFWGFEQQGVVPDIVTVAKAMGNGHPLGAVITSREVAERYRNQGYFFSSAGGSPVSSVVGLAVLDALRDEKLQQNAREVGRHLKERLTRLAEKHELIGAVHGSGLYLGVELVRDRVTREPATERDGSHLRADARTRRHHPANGRPPLRSQDQAAAVSGCRVGRLLRRCARPRAEHGVLSSRALTRSGSG